MTTATAARLSGVAEERVITYEKNGILVTPQMAAKFLRNMAPNRNVQPKTVNSYGRDMVNKQWQRTGATLAFDEYGRLQDGQHRCQAAIDTGTSFLALIVGNLPVEAYDVTDIGKKRTMANVLAGKGVKEAALLGAIAGFVVKYRAGNLRQPVFPTREEMLGFIEENPLIVEVTAKYAACNQARRLLRGSIGGGLMFEFYSRDATLAEMMLDELERPSGQLGPTDPISMLRERLIREASSVAKVSTLVIGAYTAQAWNATVTGQKLGVFRWTLNNEFPRILPE